MAETAWTVQDAANLKSSTPGGAVTLQAITGTSGAGNGNTFANDGKTVLIVFGSATGTNTGQLTVKSQVSCSHGVTHDVTTAANALDTATEFLALGPFDPSRFNDGSGLCHVQYDSALTANVKVLVVRLP